MSLNYKYLEFCKIIVGILSKTSEFNFFLSNFTYFYLAESGTVSIKGS